MSVQVKGSGTIGGIDEGLVVSGIVTATELDISGNIDVDGHTELDNINISGVSTHVGLSQFQNTINLTHASAGQNYIYFNEDLQFAKNGTGTRLKIDTSGRLLLGTTDIGYASFADNLTIADSANCGITLRSGTSNQGNIYFSDGTGTSADTYRGYITYAHADNDMLFATNSVERLRIKSDGNVLPASNNSYDLGSTSHRWRNIYTNDLNLSNEGSSNDVDGTWGNYTIQEGESDLFLINKRSGKKYKFNLTEV